MSLYTLHDKGGFGLITKQHQHRKLFSEIKVDTEKIGHELELLIASTSLTERDEDTVVMDDAIVQIVRKNQKNLDNSEIEAFKNAVNKLIQDGTYRNLTEIHADMSHNQHGSMGAKGALRFLSWHRRFLLEFEKELQKADRSLRSQATTLITIPYWRWVDDFPSWLEGFLPATDPESGNPVPPRTYKNADSSLKPTSSDVDYIINGFDHQLSGFTVNKYTKFTYGLEGNGVRSDGTELPAHNQVHQWIGGIMDDLSYSPTDPMFWLHHAEVDRLWHIWQNNNPGLNPPLTGVNKIMDPWQEDSDQLASITVLGYKYESDIP